MHTTGVPPASLYDFSAQGTLRRSQQYYPPGESGRCQFLYGLSLEIVISMETRNVSRGGTDLLADQEIAWIALNCSHTQGNPETYVNDRSLKH